MKNSSNPQKNRNKMRHRRFQKRHRGKRSFKLKYKTYRK